MLLQLANEATTPSEHYLLVRSLERLLSFEDSWKELILDNELQPIIRLAVSSPDVSVRLLFTKQLLKASCDKAMLKIFSKWHSAFVLLSSLLVDRDLSVGEQSATALLTAIKQRDEAITDCFFSDEVCGVFLQAIKCSSTEVVLRVLHLIIEVGKITQTYFIKCRELGFYDAALDLNLTEDILLKLNCIELIENLGSGQFGAAFLVEKNISSKLLKDLEDPLGDSAYNCSLLRTLAFIIERDPSQMSEMFLNETCETKLQQFLSGSESEKLCVMSVWSSIVRAGGYDTLEERIPNISKKIAEIAISSSSVALGVAAMRAFSSALVAGVKIPTELIQTISEDLLPKSLTLLLRRPFPEWRISVYELYDVLLQFKFMVEALCLSESHRRCL